MEMIEDNKDSSIVNTQQALDKVEYYADGNNCFGDIDMMEIDKDNETSTAPITSGLEKKYANH
jgi:hypothetical protein